MVLIATSDTALPESVSVTLPSATTARPGVVMAAAVPPWTIVPPEVVVSETVWVAQTGALISIAPADVSRTQSLRSPSVWLIGAETVTRPSPEPVPRATSSR